MFERLFRRPGPSGDDNSTGEIDAAALKQRGKALYGRAEYTAALECYDRAIGLDPQDAEAHKDRGNVRRALQDYDAAIRDYERASELRPDFVDAHYNLGVARSASGRFEEAVASFERAIELAPHDAQAFNNRGIALQSLARYDAALASFERAVEVEPGYADAHYNRAVALQAMGNNEAAAESFERCIALRPTAEALFERGVVLRQLGRDVDAMASFERALQIDPSHAGAHHNLAAVLKDLGKPSQALESVRRCLTAQPRHAEAKSLAVHLLQQLCAWQDLDRELTGLRQLASDATAEPVPPFAFLSLPGTSAAEQLAAARKFAERSFGALLAAPALRTAELPARERLRIGYLSGDYHEHATSYLLAEVIELHDRGRFEVIAYSHGPHDGSAMRGRMQAAFDAFNDVRGLSDEAAARRICDDDVDILVDLKGYTTGHRLAICAQRPGRLQVSWLGYPGTLGHARLADYVIGDPVVTPPGHAAHFSEALALLPHCYQPNDRKRVLGAAPARAQAGLPESGVVFCSFNQAYKITPEIFAAWCRVVQAVPESVLWLLRPNAEAGRNLRAAAMAHGIAAERVVFAPPLPLADHLGRLRLADIALDTFPYTSHTTASDALWAGVPLVTRTGDTFASRVAASILHAAGVPELVTESLGQAHEVAVSLARDGQRLAALKRRLLDAHATCPLFDSARFTRNLERLYARMWEDARAGRRECITVEER